MEVWRSIPNYEGYYIVSNLGKIKSLERTLQFGNRTRIKPEIILKPFINNCGYECVDLYKNKKVKKCKVHRLVASAFLDNPKKEVNHKDGNKLNNSVINLEWCTHSENHKHSYANGLSNLSKKRIHEGKV